MRTVHSSFAYFRILAAAMVLTASLTTGISAWGAATVMYNAWWTQTADRDQDGCNAPESPTAPMRLNWDVDVVGGGTLQVYEKVYQRVEGGEAWIPLATTPIHTISGNSTLDAQFVEVPAPATCTAFDYRVEVYLNGTTTPDLIRDPTNDANLSLHREESYAEDTGPVIADAWWSQVADANADGCWAPATNSVPTMRLNWNSDVINGGTVSVYERVYSKASSGTNWSLLVTTPRRSVTGVDASDVQWVDITPAQGCTAMDYMIELMPAGTDQPNYTRGPANDSDLANHKEQSYAEDHATTKISRVWWSDVADKNGDGCVAPLTRQGLMLLNWDADVVGNSSMSVLGKVYWRVTGTTDWILALVSDPAVITGVSTNDSQYVAIDPGSNCSTYDYRIELYRVGTSTPDDVRDSQNEPALAAHKEETYNQDAIPVITDAWWTQIADHDNDGCVAPSSQDLLMRLNWNPDIAGSSTMTVFEKVYRRDPKAADWTLVFTTPEHAVTGTATNDFGFVDLPPAGGCAQNEYKIEIYRSGQGTPSYTLTGAEDPDLAARKEESWADDNTLTVASVSWLNTADHDGDGCVAPATSKGSFRLQWDVDLVSGAPVTVYEKICRKTAGSWALLATNTAHTVTGISNTDAQQLEIQPAGECVTVEYRLEVYRVGASTPEVTLDGTSATALGPRREESYLADNPFAMILDTWWTQQADADGDGCLAPVGDGLPVRLNWRPLLGGSGTLNVQERVYRRTAGGDWVLFGLTSFQPITAGDTNVVHYVELYTGSRCAVADYRLEIYREGQAQPDAVRGPADDPNLGQRKEELYTEDNEPIRIVDAWWTNLADNDQDGCFAPTSRNGKMRLNWYANVLGTGSATVYGVVSWRENAGSSWIAVATNAAHLISGTSSNNTTYADVATPGGCKTTQYKIDLYRVNDTQPATTLTPQADPDLADLKVETYEQDNVIAKISYVWWSNTADADQDGCVAPETADGFLRLNWDPDVQGSGSLRVFERLYSRQTGTTNWTFLQETKVHQITGSSGSDAGYADLAPASGCAERDYMVEVYREGLTEPDDVKDPSQENLLRAHREETYAQDNEKGIIAGTWWSDTADRDQDGCFAPATAGGSMRLNWDANVTGPGTHTVYVKAYWRAAGSTNWALVAQSDPYAITGTATNDAQSIAVQGAAGCAISEYKLELFRVGFSTPDAVADPDTDPNLRHKEETYQQDPGQPPTIAGQPQSQKVDPGAIVAFNVVASGTQPFSYQWYFQGTNALTGATNATFAIQSVKASDAGTYSAAITNAFGFARSASATLTVNSKQPPRLSNPSLTPEGLFQFTITGAVGDVYQIQSTTTLSSWQPGSTLTNKTGSVNFTDPEPQVSSRSYRVLLQ